MTLALDIRNLSRTIVVFVSLVYKFFYLIK
jgi:hypothetical protein